MKKSTTTSRKSTGASKKASAKPVSEVHSMAQNAIEYLETHAKKLDKATIAKYAAVAALVIYGVRKSSVLRSIAIPLLTGVITKFMADKMEDADVGEIIPEAAK